MDPSIIIGLDIGLIALTIYVIDPNVFHAFYLVLSGIPTWIQLRISQTILGVRLRIDRLAFRPGLLGRILTELQLLSIRRNPAYRDFFDNKVQSDSLQEGDD